MLDLTRENEIHVEYLVIISSHEHLKQKPVQEEGRGFIVCSDTRVSESSI